MSGFVRESTGSKGEADKVQHDLCVAHRIKGAFSALFFRVLCG
jgi:hypothetical protein